jgi:hypothetical protein
MSLINDLASVIGSAATVAGVIYAACTAAEKAARPEALRDISRVIKDASWSSPVQPSAIIQRIFNLTFGERQLSWRCIFRSLQASALVYLVIALAIVLSGHRIDVSMSRESLTMFVGSSPLSIVLFLLMFGTIPDYIALAKTRLFLAIHRKYYHHLGLGIILLFTDIFVSLAISILPFTFLLKAVGLGFFTFLVRFYQYNIVTMWYSLSVVTPLPIMMSSTLFTSVRIILILVSTIVLKLLARVQRFTGRFFDVDRHPLLAIGSVAGVLVILGSCIRVIVSAIV